MFVRYVWDWMFWTDVGVVDPELARYLYLSAAIQTSGICRRQAGLATHVTDGDYPLGMAVAVCRESPFEVVGAGRGRNDETGSGEQSE